MTIKLNKKSGFIKKECLTCRWTDTVYKTRAICPNCGNKTIRKVHIEQVAPSGEGQCSWIGCEHQSTRGPCPQCNLKYCEEHRYRTNPNIRTCNVCSTGLWDIQVFKALKLVLLALQRPLVTVPPDSPRPSGTVDLETKASRKKKKST